MKFRSGFVSNSSSSSFILLVKKEDFDIKVKELSPLERAIAESQFEEIMLFSEIPVMAHSELSGNAVDELPYTASAIVARAEELAQGGPIHPKWGEGSTHGGQFYEWSGDDEGDFFSEVYNEVASKLQIPGKSWVHSEYF